LEIAIPELDAARKSTYAADARLMLAQALLAGGDTEAAARTAREVERRFSQQQRAGWALVARYVLVRAAEKARAPDAATMRTASHTAALLDAAGWHVLAADARLVAARTALALGHLTEATVQLRSVTSARTRGSVEIRVRAWHAEAMLRAATGRRRAVEPALRAGLRALDQYRAGLGSTELRVHAAAHGTDLAGLGLRLALEDGDARRAVGWTEQWRASTLRVRPVSPPEDPELAALLSRLRVLTGEVEAALLEGRALSAVRRAQAEVEAQVVALSRRRSAQARTYTAPVTARQLEERLGSEGSLVTYFAPDEQVFAAVVSAGRTTLHPLGLASEAAATLRGLHFALHRLAARHGRPAALAAAREQARGTAQELDRLLLEPLRARLAAGQVVVVPTATLHGLPWALLPSLRGRPLVVSPSATVWARADATARPSPDAPGVAVAGPRLTAAEPEVRAIAAVRPATEILVGAGATVPAVSAALDGAGWAHVAAHGLLRTDNPLFSALQLADGPLTIYDLERLARAPALVALPACQSGLGTPRAGEEVLGLASALLSLGTRTLLATVIPVPDDATAPLMVDLHSRLARGVPPAEALARAQETGLKQTDDPAVFASAAGFVCLGAG
jgi:CHAT domain-containing protein